MGEQARARDAPLDRLWRLGSDSHVFTAVLAGVLLADVLKDEQAGRPVVELLADFLTDAGTFLVAARAKAFGQGEFVDDFLAWQVLGQRSANRFAPAWFAGRWLGGCQGSRWRFFGCAEEELLGGIEAFGAFAVEPSQQHIEPLLQLGDPALLLVQAGQKLADHLLEQGRIVREFRHGFAHACILLGGVRKNYTKTTFNTQ
jgi:hypothetical protein